MYETYKEGEEPKSAAEMPLFLVILSHEEIAVSCFFARGVFYAKKYFPKRFAAPRFFSESLTHTW